MEMSNQEQYNWYSNKFNEVKKLEQLLCDTGATIHDFVTYKNAAHQLLSQIGKVDITKIKNIFELLKKLSEYIWKMQCHAYFFLSIEQCIIRMKKHNDKLLSSVELGDWSKKYHSGIVKSIQKYLKEQISLAQSVLN